MKKNLLLGFVLLSLQSYGQDYVMNGKALLNINPAFTGIYDYGKLSASANISGSKDFYRANIYSGYDTYLSKLNGGVGVYNTYQKWGSVSKMITTSVTYAYQGKIKNKLNYSSGLTFSLNQHIMNWDLIDVHCFDICPTGIEKDNSFNLVLGGLLYSEKWFLGATFSFEDESNFNLGYTHRFKKVDDLSLTTSLFLNSSYKGFTYFELQSLLNYKMIYFGAKYGSMDRYAFQLGSDLKRFKLTYGVLINTFSLVNESGITHEVNLQVKLPKTINRKSEGFNRVIF